MPERAGVGVSFGGLLRRLRTEAGLTQEELAESAGLSLRTISDLERSINRTARKETARLLADGLGLTGPARMAFEAAARGRTPADGFPASGVAVATRTLPRDIISFTGRARELAQLAAAAADAGAVVAIHAIDGMAGVGKTAFAVHAAHKLMPQFPDGQIFLPLHGHTPGQQPVDPADALASLLLTAGFTAAQIPPGLDPRMRLWRDHLARKKLLLVLDDAASSDQVQPLLPGSGSLVLVTSRRHLTALEDVHAISLDTLPPVEAALLLARLADRRGLHPGDSAIAQLTALCGYLPLAVGMLARQLHHHPAWTPAALAAELAAARDRLELMQAENLSVAAAFDLSYADLTGKEQRLFRRLGLHPGTTIDAYAVAALDDISLDAARRNLDALYEQHLLAEPAYGRYRLHDLIREYARTLGGADPADHNDAALGRLLDYYQHTATLASTLFARQTHATSARVVASPPAAVPDLPDPVRALAWARTERANLLACLDHATRTGQPARIAALTAATAALLRHDGPWTDAVIRHTTAVEAAQQLGDPLSQVGALNELGVVRWLTGDSRGASEAHETALGLSRDLGDQQGQANALHRLGVARHLTGDYPGATLMLQRALDLFRDLGDQLGQANALNELGTVQQLTGDFPGATLTLQRALGLYRNLGDRQGQAHALDQLGVVRRLTGDYQGAAEAHEAALGVFRDLGDLLGEANSRGYLGAVRRLTGDYRGAAESLEAALTICRTLGDRQGQSAALGYLGVVRRLTGDYRGAAESLEAALTILRDLGDRQGHAEVLNEMGTLHRLLGNLNQAGTSHQQALELAREIGSSWDEAHALAGLGRCALALGHTLEARARLQQALEIFQQIGTADASGVAAELDALT